MLDFPLYYEKATYVFEVYRQWPRVSNDVCSMILNQTLSGDRAQGHCYHLKSHF